MANRESVAAVRFEDFDALMAHGPGSFMWEVGEAWGASGRALVFCLPGEDSRVPRTIPVHLGPGRPAADKLPAIWGWDGNEDFPTITPSILAYVGASRVEHWHGFLTAGQFASC